MVKPSWVDHALLVPRTVSCFRALQGARMPRQLLLAPVLTREADTVAEGHLAAGRDAVLKPPLAARLPSLPTAAALGHRPRLGIVSDVLA